jgi:hypothetical protein
MLNYYFSNSRRICGASARQSSKGLYKVIGTDPKEGRITDPPRNSAELATTPKILVEGQNLNLDMRFGVLYGENSKSQIKIFATFRGGPFYPVIVRSDREGGKWELGDLALAGRGTP